MSEMRRCDYCGSTLPRHVTEHSWWTLLAPTIITQGDRTRDMCRSCHERAETFLTTPQPGEPPQ